MISTGKSVPDHFLSFTMEQDCAMWHVVKGERLCRQLPAEEVIAIREQKRRKHRGLYARRDEHEPHEGVKMAWMPEPKGDRRYGGASQMASPSRWLGDQPPTIPAGGAAATRSGMPTLQLAARSGADAGVPMYMLPPAITPPSPVIIAEAVEARKGEPVQQTAARSSGDDGLPQIPVVPKKSSTAPPSVSAAEPASAGAAAPARASGLKEISSMIAETASVDEAALAGVEIDLPLDQRKVDLSGRANLLTTDDAEIARRLADIERMAGGQPAATAPTVGAPPPPGLPLPAAVAGTSTPQVPVQTDTSPAVDQALNEIIGQGAPEAGVAAVPASVGQTARSGTAASQQGGESGIDKVKSLFAPKRQTVFGKTLVAEDGLPRVPPLAARAEAGDDSDPVVLPPDLAMMAPALGGAAVALPAPDPNSPSSAYAAPVPSLPAPQPVLGDDPNESLPPVTALTAPTWQPIADQRGEPAAAIETPVPSGRYLILGSFLKKANADRLAAQQQGVAAAVVPARIKGKTWYRVAVPEGRGVRRRVAAAGITDYWVLKM
ncbi:MAG: SPOR domain-containing protein [Kiloniellales bacterium]